jgi:glycosyltransferase involved in cell wall biosynthesis
MVRLGCDCTLITARHEWSVENFGVAPACEVKIINGVRVVSLNVLRYDRAKSLRRILGWIHFELKVLFLRLADIPRPDVVIASSLSLLSVFNGLRLRRVFRCLFVFEVRDIWPLILTENGGFSRRNVFVRLLGWVESIGYRYADRIVGTMPNLGAHVRNVLGYDRRVDCIPMGLPEELVVDGDVDVPSSLDRSFPKAEFVVTHAGSIGIDNALGTLFDAARLLKGDPRIAFFVIGKGDLLGHYKELCRDLPNVVFANPVQNKSVQPVLKRSSVLYFAAHPTVVLSFGQSLNKLIDYMYSGRPVIGSFSGFPSMINEADCGELVPAGDAEALARALKMWSTKDPELLRAVGERGRDWVVRNRSYRKLAVDYLSVMGIDAKA